MDDKRRLKRTRLIERIRTVEKARAARLSAEAEALSSRLSGVAEKTRLLASHYAGSGGIVTADDLRRQTAMRHQLHALSTMNATQLEDARTRADAALVDLGNAERKRARIENDRRALENIATARSALPQR